MEIKYIKINGLFGRYNHTIRFSEGVNIIIGDNGVGKTVCLKILKSVFNGEFEYFLRFNYHSIIISFGRELWTITKKQQDDRDAFLSHIDHDNNILAYDLIIDSNINGTHIIKSDDILTNLPPYLEQVRDNEWFDRRRGIFIDETELANRYRIRIETRGLPSWVIRRINDCSVRLIDTQRVYMNENNGRSREIGRTINKYVKDIAEIIRTEQNKASIIASNLDRTFPTRLIEVLTNHSTTTTRETIDKLISVDELSKSLHKVGLTEYKHDTILRNLQQTDNTILTVLSLYAEDMKKKLEAYSDIQGKLQLFLDIINSRFDNKKCVLNSDNEFCFEVDEIDSINGSRRSNLIEPSHLSSGEQNEFVLFYELLFNCASKNLILIDEPELSLHIKWQQMMISDLQRICEHNQLSVLIATHSPDLIGNHWSLVQILS